MLAMINGISTRAHAQHVPCVTLGLESDWNSCTSCLLGMRPLLFIPCLLVGALLSLCLMRSGVVFVHLMSIGCVYGLYGPVWLLPFEVG